MCGPQMEGIPQGKGSEGSALTPDQIFARNQAYVKPGAAGFNTELPAAEEQAFQSWAQQHNVQVPQGPTPDYDMRGFYKAQQAGDPNAVFQTNPNDHMQHEPDQWKTPYDLTFSKQSQWANPDTAPDWNNKDQLVEPGGRTVYDERARKYRPAN